MIHFKLILFEYKKNQKLTLNVNYVINLFFHDSVLQSIKSNYLKVASILI